MNWEFLIIYVCIGTLCASLAIALDSDEFSESLAYSTLIIFWPLLVMFFGLVLLAAPAVLLGMLLKVVFHRLRGVRR